MRTLFLFLIAYNIALQLRGIRRSDRRVSKRHVDFAAMSLNLCYDNGGDQNTDKHARLEIENTRLEEDRLD